MLNYLANFVYVLTHEEHQFESSQLHLTGFGPIVARLLDNANEVRLLMYKPQEMTRFTVRICLSKIGLWWETEFDTV